jgi:hypothetical protein
MSRNPTGNPAVKKSDFAERIGGFFLQKNFPFFQRKKKLPSKKLVIACTAI